MIQDEHISKLEKKHPVCHLILLFIWQYPLKTDTAKAEKYSEAI